MNLHILAQRRLTGVPIFFFFLRKCESAYISAEKTHRRSNFFFDEIRICISISLQRSLAVYFRLTRNEKKFRREVNIMMQFLFIEFFLRCDTKFVLSGMIFRLNSATIAM